MAGSIFSGESDWTVSGRVFRLLLDAARSANVDPDSRFPALVDQFDAVQVINLDQLDDLTRADVCDALLKGTAAILEQLQSDPGGLIPGLAADDLRGGFVELQRMLKAPAPGL
jgi:hypothetical protein